MGKITQAVAGFDPVPSIKQSARLEVAAGKVVPADAAEENLDAIVNTGTLPGAWLERHHGLGRADAGRTGGEFHAAPGVMAS